MNRDRFPQGPNFDFQSPADRVPLIPQPQPVTTVSPVAVALAVGAGMFILFLYALPDLALWASASGICR